MKRVATATKRRSRFNQSFSALRKPDAALDELRVRARRSLWACRRMHLGRVHRRLATGRHSQPHPLGCRRHKVQCRGFAPAALSAQAGACLRSVGMDRRRRHHPGLRSANGPSGQCRPAVCPACPWRRSVSRCHAADGRDTCGGDPERTLHATKDGGPSADRDGRYWYRVDCRSESSTTSTSKSRSIASLPAKTSLI